MASSDYPRTEHNIQYSEDSNLNTLSVYLPRPPTPNDGFRLWLVYIHGGAWRDPAIDATSFNTTQQILQTSPSISKIAGMASLNYRLSPYPSHPTNPSSPHDPSRNSRHPDHIKDVLLAILYLQETYAFGDKYLLIGHSCGATLALQVAMRRYWGSQYESTLALELNVEPPLAIMGVEGIYDIPALAEEYASQPVYRDFIANAFGEDEQIWAEASVTNAEFEESWPDGELVVIVHSRDDGLVSLRQPKAIVEGLRKQGWSDGGSGGRRVRMVELQGLEHDEVWRDGKALAEEIEKTIKELLP